MLLKIEIFTFIISLLFIARYVIQFIGELREENPNPMNLSVINQLFLYLSGSYVITSIVMTIINIFK